MPQPHHLTDVSIHPSVHQATREAAERPEVGIVALAGEMDVASGPGLLHETRAALDRGVTRLVLDLSAVTFADSTALAGLIQCRRVAYRAGADLVVVCPPGPVRSLVEATGLQAVLRLAGTRDEAVAAA